MEKYTTIEDQKKILNYLKLCFPLCGTNIQRMEELNELIEKLKNDINYFEEQEEEYKNQLEQERNLWK